MGIPYDQQGRCDFKSDPCPVQSPVRIVPDAVWFGDIRIVIVRLGDRNFRYLLDDSIQERIVRFFTEVVPS